MSLRSLSEQSMQSAFEQYTKKTDGKTVSPEQQAVSRQERFDRRQEYSASASPRQALDQSFGVSSQHQPAPNPISASNHSFMQSLASASSVQHVQSAPPSGVSVSQVQPMDVAMDEVQAPALTEKGQAFLNSFISQCPDEQVKQNIRDIGIERVPSAVDLINTAAEKGVSVQFFKPFGAGLAVADTNTKTIRIPETYAQGADKLESAKKLVHTFLFENTNCLSAEKHNKVMSKEGLESVIKFVRDTSKPQDIDTRDKLLKKCQAEFSLRVMSIETRGSLKVAGICKEAHDLGLNNFPNLYSGTLSNYNTYNAHPSFTEPQKEQKIIRFMANKSLDRQNDSGGTHRDIYSANFVRLLNKHSLNL